jgi:putative acetyltransferase
VAPLAVLPAFQRLGIGSALVSAGLERCRVERHSRVLVLGDPAYYSRFGFVPAARFGLKCPFPAREDSFMAIELAIGAFAKTSGLVRYGHEFDDLE